MFFSFDRHAAVYWEVKYTTRPDIGRTVPASSERSHGNTLVGSFIFSRFSDFVCRCRGNNPRTSLPELATAILASRRQESDIVIGNVAGSNLFNIGCILGIVACISPFQVGEHSFRWDLPIMIGFSVFLLPIALRGGDMKRWAGWTYLIGFAVFLCMQLTRL
ncbi:MAG: hypothetical protein KGQ51_11365 [Planctomycetes bacterium]|nr:hypothetical protein [Planctomycetota bacterium]